MLLRVHFLNEIGRWHHEEVKPAELFLKNDHLLMGTSIFRLSRYAVNLVIDTAVFLAERDFVLLFCTHALQSFLCNK